MRKDHIQGKRAQPAVISPITRLAENADSTMGPQCGYPWWPDV